MKVNIFPLQKPELCMWYGAQFLYDMVHKTNKLFSNNRNAGITSTPLTINTGLLKITKQMLISL